jgi:hypothetical protein
MSGLDREHRNSLEGWRYPDEKKPPADFPVGALGFVLLAALPIMGLFALKNAVVDLINSIPFLAQFIN